MADADRDVVVHENWAYQAVVVGVLESTDDVGVDKDYFVALGVLRGLAQSVLLK